MKVARIQNSLRDLNKDIGNCERQLSRVLCVKEKDSLGDGSRCRSRSVAPSPGARAANAHGAANAGYRHRQPTGSTGPCVSHLSRSVSKQANDTQKTRKSRSPNNAMVNGERNVICKEVIGSRDSPTRVEVVVRTKSSKRRSRSAQGARYEDELPTRDYSSKVKNSRSRESRNPSVQRKNASWGHILQQQNSSTCNINRGEQVHGKALQYSSTDDDHSSVELERWVQSIPQGKERTSHRSLYQTNSGNIRTPDVGDTYYSTFNPLRTLNFLVKELRGKVHEDCDENMQRIVNDMEKALCCISTDKNHAHTSPPTKLTGVQQQQAPPAPRRRSSLSEWNGNDNIHSKERVKPSSQEQKEVYADNSLSLVDRLLSTVSRVTKITGISEETEQPLPSSQKKKQIEVKSASVVSSAEGPRAQLELGCKQLEETCRQMRDSYENLKQDKNQLLIDLKKRTHQLDTEVGKNQQLTLYAADVRQEMLRQQQAFEMARQELEKVKQKLLGQQRELHDSNLHLNKRLEETLQENTRLATELQLCRLEKDKLHILMSNKDLEVAKLKKEIIDINTLVAEQLFNIRSLSGKKASPDELNKMMQRLNESMQSTLKPQEKDMLKSCNDEGSRSRPICSSPTSSVNSSLYSSWQLMSDITAADGNPRDLKEEETGGIKMYSLPKETVLRKDMDSGINSATPVDIGNRESTSRNDDTDSLKRKQQSASELKAGLHDMFQLLKKQTLEAVNITLPSHPRSDDNIQETLGMSQWTELSASESTVLFHSSEESDVDEGVP